MIFVTIGTSEPFDRLIEAVGRIPGDETVRVQCGTSTARPPRAEYVDYLPFEGLLEELRAARVVVTHAGVGSILTALTAGKRPIVVPRRSSHGEAIDDHQLTLARRLDEIGLVELVEDPSALVERIATAGEGGAAITTDGRLAADLGTYLRLQVGRARAPIPARAR